jgi:hypothetical protein
VSDENDKIATDAIGGAFVTIDESKVGKAGHKLIGGIDALMSAIAIIEVLREKSSDVQERVFLVEISRLLMQGVELRQSDLAALAVKRGAGKVVDVNPAEGKPN